MSETPGLSINLYANLSFCLCSTETNTVSFLLPQGIRINAISVSFRQVIFDNTPLQIASYESEPFTITSTVEPEPFTTMSSFFMEEEHVDTTTPLVSNEMQIESKKPLTSKNMDQRDEIAIEPIHRIPLRKIHHRQHDISRIPQQFPLGGEIPRGPPSPGPRLQTRGRDCQADLAKCSFFCLFSATRFLRRQREFCH